MRNASGFGRFDLIQGIQKKATKVEGRKVRSRLSCSLILCAVAPDKASYVTAMLAAHHCKDIKEGLTPVFSLQKMVHLHCKGFNTVSLNVLVLHCILLPSHGVMLSRHQLSLQL